MMDTAPALPHDTLSGPYLALRVQDKDGQHHTRLAHIRDRAGDGALHLALLPGAARAVLWTNGTLQHTSAPIPHQRATAIWQGAHVPALLLEENPWEAWVNQALEDAARAGSANRDSLGTNAPSSAPPVRRHIPDPFSISILDFPCTCRTRTFFSF